MSMAMLEHEIAQARKGLQRAGKVRNLQGEAFYQRKLEALGRAVKARRKELGSPIRIR